MTRGFTAADITRYLEALNDELKAKGLTGEICLYGGAAMILVWQVRIATRDIDDVFVPPKEIRAAAAQVARDLDLPDGWLNDGVKGFLSERGERVAPRPVMELSNLTVNVPDPRYLLAMKVMAARSGESQEDARDAMFLIKKLRLSSASEVFAILEGYYPRKRILPKTQFFVEALIEDLGSSETDRR